MSKVLVVWQAIPDSTDLYLLEGKDAEVALRAHGQFVDGLEPWDAADELSVILEGEEKLPWDKPYQLVGVVAVVDTGFFL
jgi:hypothetical protein